MTLYRDGCGYEPLTAERAAEFGVAPEDVELWLIESGPSYVAALPGSVEHGKVWPERLIPNTMARLARGKPILILGES